MLHAIIIVFAFFGAMYLLKEATIANRIRIWLIARHPFFYEMLGCAYCTGIWTSVIVVVLDWWCGMPGQFVLWVLAGAAVSLLGSVFIDRSID